MLGPDICSHIFFIHALLGCDTTSRLYGIGKGAPLKRFRASHIFCEQAKVFDTHSASIHDVVDAGEKALVIIYNGKSTDTLDSLRYQRFDLREGGSQALPPTSGAAKYHSLRVYLQVQEWKGSLQMNFIRQTGDGKSVMRGLCHFRHHYLLLLNIC